MKNLRRYLLIGLNVLNLSLIHPSQAAQIPRLKEMTLLSRENPLVKQGKYISMVSLRNVKNPYEYGPSKPIIWDGEIIPVITVLPMAGAKITKKINIDLFDDDGFLTLATTVRLLQEYVVQQKAMAAPEIKKTFLVDFLETPLIRQDLFRPLLKIALKRFLKTYRDFNKWPYKGAYQELKEFDKIVQTSTPKDFTYSVFFNTLGTWVSQYRNCFVFASDGRETYEVIVLGIPSKQSKAFSSSKLTVNFTSVIQSLEKGLK